jgi:hypothetical protein
MATLRLQYEALQQKRDAVVALARLAARKAVKRQIQAEGRIKWLVPAAQINRLADEYLRAHPELFEQAASSPIVQNLRQEHSRRHVVPAAKSLCGSPVRNGATIGPLSNEDRGGQR